MDKIDYENSELLAILKRESPRLFDRIAIMYKTKKKYENSLEKLVGKKVRTLRSGFCGGEGAIRLIKEVSWADTEKTIPCFLLIDPADVENKHESLSIINWTNPRTGDCYDWYRDFIVIEEE